MRRRLLGSALLATALAAQAAPSQLQRVQAAGVLRVCIWPDYYAITYRNPKTGLLSGIDIDIARALAQHLRVRLQFVDSSFPQLVAKLRQQDCDIAMHAVGITPERRAQLAFTRPHLRSEVYAVVAAGAGTVAQWRDLDQPGRVIAVQSGTVMEGVMRAHLRHARLLVVAPPMQRELEVESGRADAFMTDYPYSLRMLDMTRWATVVAPPQRFHPTDYAYALAPGDDSLRWRVERFMDGLRADGRLRQFARQHRLEPLLLDGRE